MAEYLQKDEKSPTKVVTVQLKERSYPIYIGSETLRSLPESFLEHCGRHKAAIITDENVRAIYGQTALDSLAKAGVPAHLITVKPGEKSKSVAVAQKLYDKMFDFEIERSDTIVALGGGVVGDLAGFIAATFKRGLNFVQVPTTLLAMVDSSIGGKTGINHPRGKNMIGAFHQPKMVFADTATLRTLPRRELGCGLAETVKHAVIRDGAFFELLEKQSKSIVDLEPQTIIDLVERNCRIKADVVSADERESGLRGILNFGHTIGHAIETVLPDRDYHHGEAISLGMVAAADLAQKRNLLKADQAVRIVNLLEKFDLPTSFAADVPTKKLCQAMRHDKKVKAGKINFVLPTSLGTCTFVDDLTETEITHAISALRKT